MSHSTGRRDIERIVGDLAALVEEWQSSGAMPPQPQREIQRCVARLQEWSEAADRRDRRARSIIEASLDAFLAVDSDGKIADWNPQAERIFGWSRAEAVGQVLIDLIIPPSDREAHSKGVLRCLAQGQGGIQDDRIEVVGQRRDGSEFPIELTIFRPTSAHGVPSGEDIVLHAFARDITERKRSEEALRESESLYHSLIDNLPIYVLRKDLQGRFLYVNQAFSDLLDIPIDQILGKTDFDFFPPELAEKYQADDRQVVDTGTALECIEENRTADHVYHFEVRKVPIFGVNGDIVATQAIFWDVSSRQEARAALARERDLLRTLMDHIPDFVYVKDGEGRFVTANVSLMRFFGVSTVEDIKGRDNFDFNSRELATQHVADDQRVLRTGKPLIDREECVRDAFGNELIMLVSKVPLTDREGRVTGLVGIDRNITNRKRMEEQLRRAKEEADAANRAKSHFLANMSHEIRTPMNAVLGMTELLLETTLDDSQREYLHMVHESGESLMVVLNEILDFSKIEAGKLELECEPFDLREAVGNTMKSLALRAHRKGLELACQFSSDLPVEIMGDASRLRQVIVNLVGNAIKFTDQGEVVLRVECQPADGDSVDLHFCDRRHGDRDSPRETAVHLRCVRAG